MRIDARGGRLSRRAFLQRGSAGVMVGGAGIAAGLSVCGRLAAAARNELKITRIVAQDAPGRRATPVAPNAYAAYRGYGVVERLIRIQTNHGIEGVTRVINPDDARPKLEQFIGLSPFELFDWQDGRYAGPADAHRDLVRGLNGLDIAIFDILGKATRRPVADLLGPRRHDTIDVYDSTLYMDDLLTPEQRVGLAYLEDGAAPEHDAAMVGRKAAWLVNDYYRDEGLRIFKIKTGRARWMESFEAALQRDIEVFRAVREAVGPYYTLFVDVNNGYDEDPAAASRFIEATSDAGLFGMEEMFPERRTDQHRAVMEQAWSLGLNVRNIDGEAGGVAAELLEERLETPRGVEPLFAINNPSFSHGLGFVRVAETAARCRELGVDIAPHNFASKVGFCASVHMGHATPNWAFVEIDDSAFPGVRLGGVEIRNGRARLTGEPGLGIELVEHRLSPPRFVIE